MEAKKKLPVLGSSADVVDHIWTRLMARPAPNLIGRPYHRSQYGVDYDTLMIREECRNGDYSPMIQAFDRWLDMLNPDDAIVWRIAPEVDRPTESGALRLYMRYHTLPWPPA